MAIGLGNPLESMSGASDSLGLSAAAKQSAADIAEQMRKKKQDELEKAKAVGTMGGQSAFQSLTGYGTV